MADHTPEPWQLWDPEEEVILHGGPANDIIARMDSGCHDCDEANARRIVACINACAGISTEVLEDNTGGSGISLKDVLDGRQDSLTAHIADQQATIARQAATIEALTGSLVVAVAALRTAAEFGYLIAEDRQWLIGKADQLEFEIPRAALAETEATA